MRSRPAVLAALSLLLVSACGGNSSDKDDTGDAADPGQPFAGVEFKGDFGAEPTVTVKDLAVDKLATAVLSEGDGPTVSADQSALIQLQVYSGADGTVLYSTWQAKRPSTVGPDNPPLFEGLRAAIDGQPRGSRVVLETPAADAVGAENVPKLGLKADDALVAVADILSIQDPEPLSGPDGTAVKAPGGAPKVKAKGDDVTGFDWSGVGTKPTKLQVIPLVEGNGPAIQANRLVTFNYFGEVFKGKKPFDESYSAKPITFAVGANSLIPAWDQGLIGVKEGSRVMIVAPPDMAYGESGSGGIPPNATLVFVLDVLGVDG